MRKTAILPAWVRILRGYRPLLSIEITKECPLRCPGCYAYEDEHLGNGTTLRQLSDYQGDSLVEGILALVRRYRPLHISIVGGEPLVRYRELDALLPRLDRMNLEVQLVTSAVRPIPANWAALRCLHLSVSVDGLPEHHDTRRKPATYDRILHNIVGHQITVHCTVTSQLLERATYLDDFAAFWSDRPETRSIWFSLFTPQKGHQAVERLSPVQRALVLERLDRVARRFPKVYFSRPVQEGYAHPPDSPRDCIFAQTTVCVSADLKTTISPCQFGGDPECSECGCLASAGLASIGRYRLGGLLPVAEVFGCLNRSGSGYGRRCRCLWISDSLRGLARNTHQPGNQSKTDTAKCEHCEPEQPLLGGEDNDWATGISLDAGGGITISGGTFSRAFPTTPGAFQPGEGHGTY